MTRSLADRHAATCLALLFTGCKTPLTTCRQVEHLKGSEGVRWCLISALKRLDRIAAGQQTGIEPGEPGEEVKGCDGVASAQIIYKGPDGREMPLSIALEDALRQTWQDGYRSRHGSTIILERVDDSEHYTPRAIRVHADRGGLIVIDGDFATPICTYARIWRTHKA